jgi:hypothetical protein
LAACLATGGVASPRCAARLFRLRGFEGLESTTIGAIPVALPAEVLLNLAAVAPEPAEGAVNDALVKGLVALPALVRSLQRRAARGRAGTTRLGALVEEQIRGGAPAESWLGTGSSSSSGGGATRHPFGSSGSRFPVAASGSTPPGPTCGSTSRPTAGCGTPARPIVGVMQSGTGASTP